jgi:PIN domain nuclease of toxin-antitoxin system
LKFLLDTHLLLWAAHAPERLSAKALAIFNDASHELLFSAASIWEVAIKTGLGRDDFKVDVRLFRRGLLDNGYQELPVSSAHAVCLDALPGLHKDPFDRMLVAQATAEGILLLTSDTVVASYPGPVQLV